MSTAPNRSGKKVLLGEISSAHGIRGEVLIRTHTAEPEGISAYGDLETEDGRKRFTIKIRRVTPKGVVAAIGGVADRNAAEALRGTKLFVDRAKMPEPEAGEYYHSDLIGLAAHSAEGGLLGRVVAIVNYGAGDLVEIRMEGSSKTELIPLIEAYVPAIDVAGGRMTIVLPEFVGSQEEENSEPSSEPEQGEE